MAGDRQSVLAATSSQQDPGLAFIREVRQLQQYHAYVHGGAPATYELYVPPPLPMPPVVPLPTMITGTARARRERKNRPPVAQKGHCETHPDNFTVSEMRWDRTIVQSNDARSVPLRCRPVRLHDRSIVGAPSVSR